MLIQSEKDIAQAVMQLTAIVPNLKEKQYDFELKEHKEKRSLNANNYSWLLQGKIAQKLNRRIDDIHKEMVLQYGVLEVYSIRKEAFESAKRLFDYYFVLGESELKGSIYVHCKVGIGTHNYNTTEMAHFIDGVVAECKDLGIETLDEIELKSLIDNYEKTLD